MGWRTVEAPRRGLVTAPFSDEELSEIRAALHLRKEKVTAVGIDRSRNDSSLLIGDIRDVVALDETDCSGDPVNLGSTWSGVSLGLFRIADGLLVVMDVSEGAAIAGDMSAAA